MAQADPHAYQGPTAERIRLALTSFQTCSTSVAKQHLRRFITEFPGHPLGWKALGDLRGREDGLADATAYIRRALSVDPKDTEAWSNLGILMTLKGCFQEAEICHREVIRIRPTDAYGYFNLGNVGKLAGRRDIASTNYAVAIALSPAFESAYVNLGILSQEEGYLSRTESLCLHAVAINPECSEAHNTLGNLYREKGNFESSERSFRKALVLRPDYADAFSNRGVVLRELQQFVAAEYSYRHALLISPHLLEPRSNLLYLMSTRGQMSSYLEEAKCFGKVVAERREFCYASWETDSKIIRIGLVSGDFRNHPVGYFLEGLCQHIDTKSLELVGFTMSADEDDLTERLRPRFASWHSLLGLSDADAATLIHAQKLHVLIDLSGHTASHRLGVFAYRPAPIQGTWLGYWASTGVREMDFLLGDPHAIPSEEQDQFTEEIWHLRRTRFCFTPPRSLMASNVACQPDARPVTFGCFGNLCKITPAVIHCWARILQTIPEARLLLKSPGLSEPDAREQLWARFENTGIHRERLMLEGPSSREDYLRAYGRIDVVLDTFPYPGGATSCEALWMGVPVLTQMGNSLLSRQGESILRNAGLDDWIAQDEADYVNKAIHFASDRGSLSHLRGALREQVERSALFDAITFARDFESTIEKICHAHMPR